MISATSQTKNLSAKQRVLLAEIIRRGLSIESPKPLTFREFVDLVRPGYRWFRHCVVLAEVLQKVAEGKIKRLMVFMPPRHGKSELISRLFAAYYLYLFAHRWVGICSYGAQLAYQLSRSARTNYRNAGASLNDEAAAVTQWETGKGGGLWAAGVGGPITGKGWHLGIIDDPDKNAAEAASEVIQERKWDWYQSTFYTREEPDENDNADGALIVVQTRWGYRDLGGRLLANETAEDDGQERWHIVCFDAIHEAEQPEFPASCTIEPDWRQVGEALCPERRPLEKLLRILKAIGGYFWAAAFQQNPRPRDGALFKWDWFKDRIVTSRPAKAERVRYWDTAGTEGGGDWTVGTLVAKTPDGLYWIEDVERGQWAPGHRNQRIKETADRDGDDVEIWLEQEAGVAGKDRTAETIRLLAGYTVHAEPATGSKLSRADGLASQAEAGNVRIVKGKWNASWFREMLEFPFGAHDDQVDSASGGFNKAAAERPGVVVADSLTSDYRG